jgi:hypothetical protein
MTLEGQGVLELLRQLQPRGAVILGCAMLAMAGLTAAVLSDRNGAISFGTVGALLLALGGLAWLARRSTHRPVAAPNPGTTIAALCWVALYGLTLTVMLTEPAILHRAFGTEAFGLPIAYVVPAALALLLLPLWPGFMGLAALLQRAMAKGRAGLLGIVREMRSALASGDPAERRTALKALWFFAYFILLMGAWIAYAETIGI